MKRLDYQGSLADTASLAQALTAAGMTDEVAADKARLFAQATEALPSRDENNIKPFAFFVPGRIEVLGKHTDYAGGRSMLIAVEQGFALVGRPRADRRVTIHAVGLGETVELDLDDDVVPRGGHWSNYPMTVVRRLAQNFPEDLKGVEMAFASDLPVAAGMSSSSALVIAVFLGFDAVNQLSQRAVFLENIKSDADLAGYLGAVENGRPFGSFSKDHGVGTFGGSEDHTAILCGRPGQISQYSYCPVRFERAVPIPPNHAWAIASSGVVAEKAGNALEKYNAVSESSAVLAQLWRDATGRDEAYLAEVVECLPDAVDQLRQIVHTSQHEKYDVELLSDRLEQFVFENRDIIPRAGDALDNHDLQAFGEQVARSQQGAEQLLGNQVPETIFLASSARQFGAAAASAFGAGFGGSVWAMVETEKIESFLDQWQAAYLSRFPEAATHARFFSTTAGPAAFRVC